MPNAYQAPSTDLFPPVIKNLLILNGLVFLAQQIPPLTQYLQYYGALWPLGLSEPIPGGPLAVGFYPWQLVTSAFMHADLWHIGQCQFATHFGKGEDRLLRRDAVQRGPVGEPKIRDKIVGRRACNAAHPTDRRGERAGLFTLLKVQLRDLQVQRKRRVRVAGVAQQLLKAGKRAEGSCVVVAAEAGSAGTLER